MRLIQGFYSVDGEWIVAKKDWKEAKRRAKSKERRDKSKERREKEKPTQESTTTDSTLAEDSEFGYTPDMDEQRCILYFHGGKPSFRFGSRVVLLPWFSDLDSLYLFGRGILLRERGPGAVQHPAFCSEDQWTCVW